MLKYFLFIPLCISLKFLAAQETTISGTVLSDLDSTPIENAEITIEGQQFLSQTDSSGRFQLQVSLTGDYVISVSFQDYRVRRIPVLLESRGVDIGTIYLERDITFEKNDNLITLTDAELLDDEGSSNALGLLQSTRDVFLTRAAFDFGQAFFRVRGYDSQNGEVLLNGIPMNKLFDGRPQWNNWCC
ncbi:carboxypeptidase regulatory-like domain-containing protein [Maribacter aestuarii]|uniref:carboxypeptidase regulatory-like domain-containing protein n=1 Tax=Maribacter aestuarii TaxID=1130723 RepID=UPI00248BD957|nr:carboxypeptidase regulatory-like domain-containing protein [Maribacter aestuarii]